MSLPITYRNLFLALFALCCGLLSFGLYLQHVEALEPCPMCIMQRYALALVGLGALIGAALLPRAPGARVTSGVLALIAGGGASVAARQSWMQLNPPAIPECGPGLEFMLDSFGLADALPMIFRGAGDCSEVKWTFLDLSIANWSLINFSLITIALGWVALRGLRSRR